MQIANQERGYPETELVCFSKDENGGLRYDGLMKLAIITENTYTREIKELTGEEYLAVDKSNLPDKNGVLHTARMLELYKSVKDYQEEEGELDLKLRADWMDFVTPEEIEKRNSIVDKVNKRGYILKSEASFLLKFDQKTRCCSDCEITFDKATAWMFAKGDDRYGIAKDVGLFQYCFDCDMKRMMADAHLWGDVPKPV
jgi:hypothetical protein